MSTKKPAPPVNRCAPLDAWLEHHRARKLWDEPLAHANRVQCYAVNGRTLIVQRYGHGGCEGWELYTPCSSAKVEDTLADATLRMRFGAPLTTADPLPE